ncbi:MAG: FtsQ-type POTRA domain-containing protein [Clostridia bacterium]|nr:FtsQ-type POTRA domain-containing protein [Clostridia bacterium]
MGKPHVFARQSNMYAGYDQSPEARSAGREGLEQPGRVLYVYDRVSTKDAMKWRMDNTPLPKNGTDLSGVYKKKAHIQSDMERNLKHFYASGKGTGKNSVHMGRIVDESVRTVPETAKKHDEPDFSDTQTFGNRRTSHQQRYAAFEQQEAFRSAQNDGHTRMFSSPVNGGTAVKQQRHPWLRGIYRFLETLEERQASEVDAAKKQALIHKKLQEHRRGLTLALVILLIFGICCTAIYELLFVVRSVEAVGSERYSAGEVILAAGISEGTTNLYDFRAEEIADRITFYCPYIRSAELERQLPAGVTLTLTDDSAVYCANIYGEIVALSAGLRVLDTLSPEEAEEYILLRLPAVAEAVSGRPLVFAEARNERYIRKVLEDVNASEMNGRVSYMDLRDDQNIVLHCDGMFALELGNSADLLMKIRMGSKSIADPMFPQNTPARIDLSVVGEASVRADLRLDLTETP